MKIRLLYRKHGDHISFRDASEHVLDQADVGSPLMLRYNPVVALPDEVEFDHRPTEDELNAAFGGRYESQDQPKRSGHSVPVQQGARRRSRRDS